MELAATRKGEEGRAVTSLSSHRTARKAPRQESVGAPEGRTCPGDAPPPSVGRQSQITGGREVGVYIYMCV